MTKAGFVHPEFVAAMKKDLHRAMTGLHRELATGWATPARAREIATLIHDWNDYAKRPSDWLTAPDELEIGCDLEARIVTLQGAPPDGKGHVTGPHAHRAGELFGMHTVGDLSDLRDALSYEVGMLTAAYNECAASWQAADAATHDPWKKDFDAAQTQFGSGWNQAQAIIGAGASVMSLPYPGVDDAWNALTATVRVFSDLDRRMRAAGMCNPPDYKDMPQPKHGDLDLSLYNFSGSILKGVQKGAEAVGTIAKSAVPWVLVAGALALAVVVAVRR